MQDRLNPKHPNRMLITPEGGGAPFYATMIRADEPEQEGTPLNKKTFLTDETAASLGLDNLALPDDALRALKSFIDANADAIATGVKIVTGSYTGTGAYGVSNPNSLTFGFVPKLIWFTYYYRPDVNRRAEIGFLVPDTFQHENGVVSWNYFGTSIADITASISGNTVSWYSTADATRQRNESGVIYNYIVFG